MAGLRSCGRRFRHSFRALKNPALGGTWLGWVALGLFFCWLVVFVMISVGVVAAHGRLLLDAISLRFIPCLVIPHPSEFTIQLDRAGKGLLSRAFNQNLFALSQPMAPSCALVDAF